MKWILFGAVLVLCLCLILPAVFGIECYVCSSKDDPNGCTESSVHDRHLKNCSELKGGPSNTMCRKIRQWVDYKYEEMDALDRTIRTCGNTTTDRDYYYRAGFGGRVGVYTCYEDKCNSAPSVKVGLIPIVVSMAAMAVRHLV